MNGSINELLYQKINMTMTSFPAEISLFRHYFFFFIFLCSFECCKLHFYKVTQEITFLMCEPEIYIEIDVTAKIRQM